MFAFMFAMQRRAVQAFMPKAVASNERRRVHGMPLSEGSIHIAANSYIADLVDDLVEQPVTASDAASLVLSDVVPKPAAQVVGS